MMPDAEEDDPRSILEKREDTPESYHEELAFALGRLLVWLLQAQKLPLIGQRVYIAAYKIRPDLVGGATLEQIAKLTGHGRSKAHNLSRELSDMFGVRGLNDRGDQLSTPRYRRAWTRAHKTGRRVPLDRIHLDLINRFKEWETKIGRIEGKMSPQLRARILRDFEPIRRWLEAMGPTP